MRSLIKIKSKTMKLIEGGVNFLKLHQVRTEGTTFF